MLENVRILTLHFEYPLCVIKIANIIHNSRAIINTYF